VKSFQELNVKPIIIKALEELGFENPMPVQEQVIPLLLESSSDIIALAQTGTGKTAAFGIPVIQQVDLSINKPQALILAPTRELCVQISDDLNDYSKYIGDLKVIPVYGGASIDTQISALRKGAHVIVATPGRLIDLIERKAAKLDAVKKVILDEADEMLNMGFSDSIETIFSYVPEGRQMLLFSATMPSEIASIAKRYMGKYNEVVVGSKNSGADNIKHICYTVHAKDKYLVLKRIADYYPDIYGIVFCRTRRETQEIADKLMTDGYNAEALHGDLSQSQRDYVMNKFRIKNVQLLVATDVAARGIDVDNLTHVINYNIPDEIDSYNHRSGRTGRAGKAGISIVISNLKEKFLLKQIERKISKSFINAKVPSGKEICEKQLFHLIEKIERVEINHEEIEPYLPLVYKKLEWMDKEELIKRLVSFEFNEFLNYYKDAANINDADDDRGGKKKLPGKSGSTSTSGMSNLYINVGKIDGINPVALIELVNNQITDKKIVIGKIEIGKKHTVFEVESGEADNVLSVFNNVNFEGRQLHLKYDTEPKSDRSFKPERRNEYGGGGGGYKKKSYGGSDDQKKKSYGGSSDYNKKRNKYRS